jgi:hypothetical protein
MKGLGRKAKTATDDVTVLRDYLQQFANSVPIIDGQLVSGVVTAGISYVLVPHSLGRSYRGGICTAVSFPTGAIAQTPDAASLAGIDTTKNVLLYLTAVAGVDVTLNFWVF